MLTNTSGYNSACLTKHIPLKIATMGHHINRFIQYELEISDPNPPNIIRGQVS